jgi:hypothetical protein
MAQRRSLSKLLRIQPIRLKIEALGDPDVQRATDNGRYENLGALRAYANRSASPCAGFEPYPSIRTGRESVTIPSID